MRLECRFYWVKYYNKWTIAELTETNWQVIGEEESVWLTEIDEIGSEIFRNKRSKSLNSIKKTLKIFTTYFK